MGCMGIFLLLFSFFSYAWGIHGIFIVIFTGYTYVSVMCRLCIGNVSVMYRLYIGTDS